MHMLLIIQFTMYTIKKKYYKKADLQDIKKLLKANGIIINFYI